MLRLILTALYMFLYFIFTLFYRLFTWPFRRKHPEKFFRADFAITRRLCKGILFFSGTRLTFTGLENLPKDETVLYVMNHRSIFDIVIAITLMDDPCGFVAKKELAKIPVFAGWLSIIHVLFLDRANLREGMKTILQGIEFMKSGISMFIFPEGTRNKDTDLTTLLPFRDGALKLAERSHSRIVPIAFYNTAAIFEDQKPRLKKANVKVSVGEPIDIGTLEPEQKKFLGNYISGKIIEMLKAM